MSTPQPEALTRTLTFPEVLTFLRRGAPLALVAMLLSGAIAAIVTRGLDPVYRASVSIVASRPPSTFGNLDLVAPPALDAITYQRALLDGSVLRDALTVVNSVAPTQSELERFKGRIQVTVDNQPASSVLRIDVDHSNPALAAQYVNEVATQLIVWDRNRAREFVDSSIGALERAIDEIDSQIASTVQVGAEANLQAQQAMLAALREQRVRELDTARARSASALVVGALSLLSPAAVPQEAIGPRLVFNTFVAAVLGALVGYAAQYVRWSMRNEVGNWKRLSAITRLPVLSIFPRSRSLRVRGSGEAGSFFRANLMKALKGRPPQVIGITSPAYYSEKVGVAAALAEKLATSGYRTLLIDGDLRKHGPGLGMDVKSSRAPGLEEYLKGDANSVQPIRVVISHKGSFDLVPTNTPTAQSSELLEGGLRQFLELVTSRYEMVIIDLPPALGYADAITISEQCSGMVICTSVATNSRTVADAASLLEHGGANLIGSVLTGVTDVQRVKRSSGLAVRVRDLDGAESAGSRTRAPIVRIRQR